MTPERWQQIKAILSAVLERPAVERQSFLDQVCAGDGALRDEVESLMAHQETGDSFIGSAKISERFSLAHAITSGFLEGQPATSDRGSNHVEVATNSRLGPYRIIRELGRGGVGSVYLAERDDDQYRRHVAIKLIRRGMDTDFILRRFRNERQILAALDHPNVARLLDGGTTEDGRPYLVMEYVEGVPIDVYCDQGALDIDERLSIFQRVCAAAHYAHQHLVIHRDIKPGNILVTKEGTPKLLDFGIAKLLTPELAAQTLDATLTAMRLLTPAYASPEQVKGEPITTATDVYSLGVLLHELLTGHKPYRVDSRAPMELMQAVLEKEAMRPSTAIMITETLQDNNGSRSVTLTPELVSKTRDATPDRLRRRLRGDLDNIVLTALRKDPQRRYASVQQFSEDIRRHLKGLPVTARPDTLGYRTAKFIHRNRISVAAAAMVLIILIGGIVAVNQQRRRAERRFNDVRKLAHAVVFDYHDAIADLPGSTPARQRMVKDALEYLDNLAKEASGDRSLQRELATAYRKIGDVQGNSNMANLGDTPGALASYRKSLVIRQALLQSDSSNDDLRIEVSESHERIGDVLRTTGEVIDADKHYQQAINLLETKSTTDKGQQRLADLLYRVGNLKGYPRTSNLGDTKGAIEYHGRALAIRESLAKAEPTNVDLQVDVAESHRSLANMLATSGSDLEAAEPHARQAVSISKALMTSQSSSTRALRALTESLDALARQLLLKGETSDALAVCLESLETAERLLTIDPRNMQARQDLASGHTLAGNIYAKKHDLQSALKHHHEALASYEAIGSDDPTNESVRRWIGQTYMNMGTALAENGDSKAAVRNYERSLMLFEALLKNKPADNQTLQSVARNYDKLGEVFTKVGDLNAALESYRHAAELFEQALSRDSGNDLVRRVMAMIYFNTGEVCSHLATQRKTSESERTEQWRTARQTYQRSSDLFLELRGRRVLPKEFADKADQIPTKIAACDAALSRQSK